jgi:hypothetical protein
VVGDGGAEGDACGADAGIEHEMVPGADDGQEGEGNQGERCPGERPAGGDPERSAGDEHRVAEVHAGRRRGLVAEGGRQRAVQITVRGRPGCEGEVLQPARRGERIEPDDRQGRQVGERECAPQLGVAAGGDNPGHRQEADDGGHVDVGVEPAGGIEKDGAVNEADERRLAVQVQDALQREPGAAVGEGDIARSLERNPRRLPDGEDEPDERHLHRERERPSEQGIALAHELLVAESGTAGHAPPGPRLAP